MSILDPSRQWLCPRCGALIEGHGPASLEYSVTNHRWRHERDDKLAAERTAAAMPGYQGTSAQGSLYGQAVPLDEAFYDGARLTPGDWSFMKAMRVCWNRPRLTLKG